MHLQDLWAGSKHNTTVINKLRTSTKIIRSTKEDLFTGKIRPLPRARPRKTGGRKRGKTRILTDTPEKKEIEKPKNVSRVR
jgi:hypothetical protein